MEDSLRKLAKSSDYCRLMRNNYTSASCMIGTTYNPLGKDIRGFQLIYEQTVLLSICESRISIIKDSAS